MQIYVQKLSDPLTEWPLDVESSDTILGVISKVIDAELPTQYSSEYIKLFFDGTELNPSSTLSDYNIQKNSHLTSSYTPPAARATKKHTFLGRTVQAKPIFFQGLRSIVFQEASNYSIEYGHFDYGTYGNTVAFVQEPSVDTVINYVISLGAGKRLWTFSPINPAFPVLEIILDFPGTNTENAPPYKPIWYLSYSLGDFGGAHPPFSANGTEYNITVNPALTCYNSDAQVLMEGWEPYGPRTLDRVNENLYYYGAETVYRADTLTPWSYATSDSPFVTSLTVAPFPWQAEWPAPFTSTKVCS